ncbi:hypothetical protein PTKIN_Ptkin16aG0103100 [Pterospermum kingtungense]
MGLKCIHPNRGKYPGPLTKNVSIFSQNNNSKHYQDNRQPKFITVKQLKHVLKFWVLSESSGKASCFFAPPVSSSAFKVSHCSVVSTLSAKKTCHPKKNLKHPRGLKTNVSAEGLPSELFEDSKFVPLNADDPTYGPPVSSDTTVFERDDDYLLY